MKKSRIITAIATVIAAAAALSVTVHGAVYYNNYTNDNMLLDPATGTYTYEPDLQKYKEYDNYTYTYNYGYGYTYSRPVTQQVTVYTDMWGNTYTEPVVVNQPYVVRQQIYTIPAFTVKGFSKPVHTSANGIDTYTSSSTDGTVLTVKTAKDSHDIVGDTSGFSAACTERIGRQDVTFYGNETGYTFAVWYSDGRTYTAATSSSVDFFTMENIVKSVI